MPEEKEPQIGPPEKSEEEKHKEAYRLLTNLPEGLEASDWQLKEWVKRYNETISIRQEPVEEVNGWYIYMPDGKRQKLTDSATPVNKPNTYLVYYPNGDVRLSKTGPIGIEVKYASK